ncbi:MAG: hypothetical protein FDZ75_04020, partial [Actinobacteria bacterium]
RYVVFVSSASNLVAGDTNGRADVFIRDLTNSSTKRLSVSNTGEQANGDSADPSISSSGQFVTFSSSATNLVRNDLNGFSDIFVKDTKSQWVGRASLSTIGTPANGQCFSPAISPDGRFVAFTSSATNLTSDAVWSWDHIYLNDTLSGRTTLVASSGSAPAISSGGSRIAFVSATSYTGDDSNGTSDVYVTTPSGGFVRCSTAQYGANAGGSGAERPAISSDGRIVTFSSPQALTTSDFNSGSDVYAKDLVSGNVALVSYSMYSPSDRNSYETAVSPSGAYVAYVSEATVFGTKTASSASRQVFVSGMGSVGIPTTWAWTRRPTAPASSGETIEFRGRLTSNGTFGGSEVAQLVKQTYGAGASTVAIPMNVAGWGANYRDFAHAETLYRNTDFWVIFRGSDGFAATTGVPQRMRVLVRPYVGKPNLPRIADKGRTYTVVGVLRPRHPERTVATKIYLYRWSGGKWVLYKKYGARAYNYSTYSKYKARVVIPSAGTWSAYA